MAISYIACLCTPKRYRWLPLLVASVSFYYFAGIASLITLVAASVVSFACGIYVEKLPLESPKRRTAYIVGILLVIGWLVTVKICIATGWTCSLIAIPLGVSYVSFSVISYLTDIYWERDTADKNLFKHMLYVLFFPKISQGPIARHNKLSQTLYVGRDMTYKNLTFGLQRMIYGFFKKLVVADRLAMITGGVFADVSRHSGSVIVVATVFAAIELYCDFSGYMDIMLGFVQTLGIEMEENFKNPFFSRSAAEFWRRWHITLGTWFKDYVYTPLAMSRTVKKIGKWGKKKVGKKFGNAIIKIVALAAVWLLTGLWHGTGVNYILWGVMWGVIIITSTIFEEQYQRITQMLRIDVESSPWKLFQMIRTFAIFCFGILLTRTKTLFEVKLALFKIVAEFNLSEAMSRKWLEFGVSAADFKVLVICFLAIFGISMLQQRGSVREQIAALSMPVRWVIYALGISVVLLFGAYGAGYTTNGFAYTYF